MSEQLGGCDEDPPIRKLTGWRFEDYPKLGDGDEAANWSHRKLGVVEFKSLEKQKPPPHIHTRVSKSRRPQGNQFGSTGA